MRNERSRWVTASGPLAALGANLSPAAKGRSRAELVTPNGDQLPVPFSHVLMCVTECARGPRMYGNLVEHVRADSVQSDHVAL
jgi:hypothetical protein